MTEEELNNKIPEDEILRVDKPKGISSFDVIRILRKKLNIKKMGHAGTLDPLASGLMLVGINKGTKKMHQLLGLSKVYEVDVLLGMETETGDMEGKIVSEMNIDNVDDGAVKTQVQSLVGELLLAVPIYSAIKVDGKRLYEYAREGKEVEIPEKVMKIYDCEMISGVKPYTEKGKFVVSVRMSVGSGVYVRSVVLELGRRLGFPATVKELRRVSIGDYNVKGAISLQEEVKNFSSRVKSK